MDLVVQVYAIVRELPREERFELGAQLKRCAVSVPSNLAEGHAKGTRKEFHRYVLIALGSLAEVETQLELVRRLGLSKAEPASEALHRAAEVGRALTVLRMRLAVPRRLPKPLAPSPQPQ
jgi:four helix bundle protein